MNISVLLAVAVALPLITTLAHAAEDGAGDFSIRAVVPLDQAQLVRLRKLAKNDPEAVAIAAETRADAERRIDAKPHPLEVIEYEGLVRCHRPRTFPAR